MNRIITRLTALLACLLALPQVGAQSPVRTINHLHSDAALVLVIDDLGYHKGRGAQVINLPGAVTVALLPHAPHSAYLARLASAQGKDVILHQPMQPATARKAPLGTLTADMTNQDFVSTLRTNLAALPHIKGVNNHTGSLLTQQTHLMDQLMVELKREGLFFLDSRTTHLTVAAKVAQQHAVPVLSRDIFLDNSRHPADIHAQFHKALTIARRDGLAVVIAHPYPESIAYLREALPALPSDIELMSLSSAMPSDPAAPDQPESPGYPRRSLGL